MDSRAEAIAQRDGIKKASAIKALKVSEEQRRAAKKIKHVRGKLAMNSTTIITIQLPNGETLDIFEKSDIEQAIMQENKTKYQQAFYTPFMRPPLISDFGLLVQVLVHLWCSKENINHPIIYLSTPRTIFSIWCIRKIVTILIAIWRTFLLKNIDHIRRRLGRRHLHIQVLLTSQP